MLKKILEITDEYLSRHDYDGAEKHLLHCLESARDDNDHKIILALSNELMGLYRKLSQKEKAFFYLESALQEVSIMNIYDNTGAATTYINCATVYKAFGDAEKAIPLFEKARTIYEKNLNPDDERLGGLYNNMGLALVDVKRFIEAKVYYDKALRVMERIPGKEPEQAITWLNMASCVEAEFGLDEGCDDISKYVEKAMELMELGKERLDGNYAFVCEKCAGVFGYFGYFLYEKELNDRAGKIYERT